MKKKWFLRITLVGSLLVAGGVVAASGFEPMPGSADDPLVTKSFVEQLVDAKLKGKAPASSGDEDGASGSAPGSSSMKVETLEPGEKIIGQEGTQFIVRTGKVKAVAGENGDGLPDVTEGVDIKGGYIVPANHLILIPKSDSRGLVVAPDSKKSFIMVIGDYHVE